MGVGAWGVCVVSSAGRWPRALAWNADTGTTHSRDCRQPFCCPRKVTHHMEPLYLTWMLRTPIVSQHPLINSRCIINGGQQ